MKTAFLILLVLALAAAASACGDTCTSTCDEHNHCAGAFYQPCGAQCNASSDEASHLSCTSQYDTLQTCIGSPPAPTTVCDDDPGTRCGHEQAVYNQCKTAYCTAHPAEPACRTPTT